MDLDDEQQAAMDKMAEFVVRNGSSFEEMMRAKQKFNPKFAFLFNGDRHHGYYRARVAELKAAAAAAVKTHSAAGSEEATKIAHFKAQLLRRVMNTGTRANVKETTFWSLEQGFSDKGCFELVLALQEKALSEQKPERRTRCLLLASDLLYHSTRTRVSEVVQPLRGSLPALCFSVASLGDEGRQTVEKLLRIWEEDDLLTESEIASLRTTIAGPVPPRPLMSDLPPARDEDEPLYATTPAGLMVPAMRADNDFEPVDPDKLQPLPYIRPCSQRIEHALHEFFGKPKHPRTADGWERGALDFHYNKAPRWIREEQQSPRREDDEGDRGKW